MSRCRMRTLRSEINVVPYVDVMLVLLVIFMIAAPMLSQGVEVDLPNVSTGPLDTAEEPVTLTVDSAGRFYFSFGGDTALPLDEQELVARAAALLRRNPDVRIWVRGDEDATHGRVTRAIGLLHGAGASRIAIVTDLPARDDL